MEELELTPKQTKEAIDYYFERLPHLPILLCGPSGIGKTDISRQIAREREWDYLDIRLAGMLPEDLRGYPKSESWMDVKARKELGVGGSLYPELKFILIDKLNSIFETQGPGLLDFEEINRAHPDVHQPIFQLIGDRMMDNRVMGDEWRIIASINPDSDSQYIVNAMDMAFTRRWVFINIIPDLDSWLEYAERVSFHPVVMRYLKMNPTLLYKSISDHLTLMPAVWERVSRLLYSFQSRKELSERGLVPLQLLVGKSTGNEVYTLAFKEMDEDLYVEDIIKGYSSDKRLRSLILKMVKKGEISLLTKIANGVASIMPDWTAHTMQFVIDLPNDLAQIFQNAFGNKDVNVMDPLNANLLADFYTKMNNVKKTT